MVRCIRSAYRRCIPLPSESDCQQYGEFNFLYRSLALLSKSLDCIGISIVFGRHVKFMVKIEILLSVPRVDICSKYGWEIITVYNAILREMRDE